MSLIARLSEKSWLTPGIDGYADPAEYRPHPARVGLWVYLGVVTVLFALLTAAYLMRMAGHGAVAEHDWHSLPKPTLLWVNTATLVLASIAWEWARGGLRRGSADRVRAGLFVAGMLGFLFLIGQLAVWRTYHDWGYFLAGPSLCLSSWSALGQPALHVVSSNPAIAFLYLITAIHGLHIAGGLGVWARAVDRMRSGGAIDRIVALSATYWHFLLLVWLLMFGLLLST